VLAVNLTAAFRLARACCKGMMKRRFGRIIGITSVVGVTGNPGQGNYAASKAGLIGMSKSLARRSPAATSPSTASRRASSKTAMTDVLNDKQKEAILGSVPAGPSGRPRATSRAAAAYLASAEAGYVTGQTLHVNGGMAMI
jgi:3-oxoacyl-[acyl-carrier protein] reductase